MLCTAKWTWHGYPDLRIKSFVSGRIRFYPPVTGYFKTAAIKYSIGVGAYENEIHLQKFPVAASVSL
jgi:hypothetical protein